MPTTRELIDGLERNRALFNIALEGTDLEKGGMNPLVAEALASAPPAGASDVVKETAEKVAASAASSPAPAKAEAPASSSLPFTPGVAVSVPSETESDVAGTFYDMLMRNDAYRLANSEAFERNEKANAARTRIAAVADALASLGNLVGTTHGAFSQPQTYQTPFVTEQVEADRANARKLANALFENENSLRLAKMRMDASGSSLAEKLALQDAISQRALANAAARDALEEKKHGYRTAENEQKAGYTREQHDIDNAVRKDIAAGNNATSRATAATRADATKYSADKRAESAGGGSVGGYTTTTQSEYDELGRKVRETKTRTGANGQTTTTTTTPGGRKPNPMGSAPQQGGKKKKKNPMN